MCDDMTWSCQPTLQFVELIYGAVRIVGAGGRLRVEYPPVNNVLLGHRSFLYLLGRIKTFECKNFRWHRYAKNIFGFMYQSFL